MKSKTKPLIFSLFFVLILMLSLFIIIVPVKSFFGSVVIEAYEDTWVNGGSYKDWCFEGNTTLVSGHPSGSNYVYIRFNITDLQEAFNYGYFDDDVHIRLFYTLYSGTELTWEWRIYRCITDWDNDTMTYNTGQPTLSEILYSHTIDKVQSGATPEFVFLEVMEDFRDVLEEDVDYFGYMIYAAPVNEAYSGVTIASIEAETYAPAIVYGYDEDEEEEEGVIGGVSGDFLANWFIYAIFFVVIPIAMVATISNMGDNVSPSMMLTAFMASETLMTAITVSINLVGIWFMLIIIIADIMIIFGLMKGRG